MLGMYSQFVRFSSLYVEDCIKLFSRTSIADTRILVHVATSTLEFSILRASTQELL